MGRSSCAICGNVTYDSRFSDDYRYTTCSCAAIMRATQASRKAGWGFTLKPDLGFELID